MKETSIRRPGDLNSQIDELLDGLTADLSIWRALATQFHVSIFCGLFMQRTNEGWDVATRTLMLLAERDIQLCLDIYDPTTPGRHVLQADEE